MTRGKQGADTASMKPYADDEAAMTIGGFSIENGATRVALSGSLDLTKDKAGLAKARELKGVLDAIVDALANASDLPDAMTEDAKPAKTVKNPFE